MLQDLQERGLERAERKRCVQAGKEVAADNPFVSQCVPQEVGCRARHQGSHDRGPSAQAKSQALWLAGGEAGLQAGVYALRQKRGERVLQQRVKRRVGDQARRKAEPEEAACAVRVRAVEKRHHIPEVRHEASDDERRRDGEASEHVPQRNGRGRMREGVGHRRMLATPA